MHNWNFNPEWNSFAAYFAGTYLAARNYIQYICTCIYMYEDALTIQHNDDMTTWWWWRSERYGRFRCGKLSARLFPISYSGAISLYRPHRTTDRFADCKIFNLINGREDYERLAAMVISAWFAMFYVIHILFNHYKKKTLF